MRGDCSNDKNDAQYAFTYTVLGPVPFVEPSGTLTGMSCAVGNLGRANFNAFADRIFFFFCGCASVRETSVSENEFTCHIGTGQAKLRLIFFGVLRATKSYAESKASCR